MTDRDRSRSPLELARGRQAPSFYVIDDELNVIFRTATANGEAEGLPAGAAAVIRRLMQVLGSSGEPSAVGIVSATKLVRLLRMESQDVQEHFAVFIERFAARNSLQQAASRFSLSRRETDVLEGLMRGESTDEIARRLGIGATTVHEHIRKIGRKTDVTKRSAIVATVFGFR